MGRWFGAILVLTMVGAVAAAIWMLEVTRYHSESAVAGAGVRAPAAVRSGWNTAIAPRPADTGVGGRSGGFGRSDGESAAEEEKEAAEALVIAAPPDFRTRAAALGVRVVETLSLTGLGLQVYRVGLPADLPHEAALARLRARFPGAAVDSNHHYRIAGSMSLPDSVARKAIGWEAVSVRCGAGLRIGMIDAAVDIGHPALRGARISYRSFAGQGRRPGEPEHGTAVAGLLVGQYAAGRGWGGLVPDASLYAANIFEVRGSGRTVATAGGLLKAVDWVINRRVHAVNLSIAGPDNRVVREAVSKVQAAGVVLIAAAGNWGSDTRPAFPAAYDAVIAVTAIGTDRTVYRHANRGPYIEFAAPGVRLWTAVPDGGKFQSGTSFATPFVSTLAGLAVMAGEAADPDRIRAVLQRDTVDLGTPGRDTVYGWGLIGARPDCSARAG